MWVRHDKAAFCFLVVIYLVSFGSSELYGFLYSINWQTKTIRLTAHITPLAVMMTLNYLCFRDERFSSSTIPLFIGWVMMDCRMSFFPSTRLCNNIAS